MSRRSLTPCIAAFALFLGFLHTPNAAAANTKLYLTDGTYQICSSYEVHGDRVRYFSVERAEWEEIPTSLVDFVATKKNLADEKAADKQLVEEAKETEKQRFYKAPNQGFEVAPDVKLPGDDGVFTVDGKRLVRMVQMSSELVTDKKRAAMMLAVPLPVVKAKSLVVLDGPKAAIRLSDPMPVFYVQSSAGLGTKLELVHLKPGKESRIVEDIETARGKNGKSTEDRATIAIERKQLAPNLYSIRPQQPLDAGEYVLGEVVDDKLSLDVYDFGYEKWEVVK